MVELELWEVVRVDEGLEGEDEGGKEGELSVSEYESSARPCFASPFISSLTLPPDPYGRSALRILLSALGSFLG